MTIDWLEHISVILPDSFFQVHLIPDFIQHISNMHCFIFCKRNGDEIQGHKMSGGHLLCADRSGSGDQEKSYKTV